MGAAEIEATFADGTGTIATAWVVTRADGVVMGFTDHDRDLVVAGVTCEANSGLVPHPIERSLGGNVDTSQVAGALSAAAIEEADILAGRYDGAEVAQWLVNWRAPDERMLQFRARIGEIVTGDGRFEAELLSLTDALNRPVGRAFLRRCDRVLGDGPCGVDLDGPAYRADGTVLAAEGRGGLRWDRGVFGSDWFTGGQLVWLSGANAGLTVRVAEDDSEAERLVLAREAAFAMTVGDRFTLVAGCDKRATTCRDKFDNLVNFRGFPHLPGSDWVTVYPRSGQPPKSPAGGALD